MVLPKLHFDSDGNLSPGTHEITKELFLETFCFLEEGANIFSGVRHRFQQAFSDMCNWADRNDATSIVVGGSFVTDKPYPNDIDVIVFFKQAKDIPRNIELLEYDGVRCDIQVLSEDQPQICEAFVKVLATSRRDTPRGVVQIKFDSQVKTHHTPHHKNELFDVALASYQGRKITSLRQLKGVVVPIHGILSDAEWVPHMSLILSTSGWAVAPYVYGKRMPTLLSNSSDRARVVEGFRDWLTTIRSNFDGPISILAHSFGTYVIAKYLSEAGDLTSKFDSIILCGSILSKEFDWSLYLEKNIGRVLNTVSEEDQWVKYMPEGGRVLVSDPLYGDAGREGFNCSHPNFSQVRSKLLQHSNIFKDDVIRGLWLPFLDLAKGS
ncbi:hypothetical protein GTP91_06985 [Rugamonas sp. FT82W]|uniref:Alpha/beta hydrolase n=1 Tax=Duganella vulcania TaxID=2692166 RepID=A0A845G007_9BURK|nr:hypothetical protein [Duganella vulcania]MYM86930.1 hypothetical protein [Duganella vulcania]